MKHFIFIMILLALMISVSIWESVFITKEFDYLEANLITIQNAISLNPEQIDTEENLIKLRKLHKEWKKTTHVLKMLVWHTGIKEVEIGLSRITTYTEQNEYTEAMVEINNLKDFSNHYAKDFKVLWENIL